jgi:hypothetical protein
MGQLMARFRVRIADNLAAVRHNHRTYRGHSDVAKRGDIEVALRRLAPRIPSHEFEAVVDHAVDSPGLNVAFPETAAWLSLVAYVRHTFTDYDELLREGYDQDSARFFVGGEIAAILDSWGVRRRLTSQD